MLLPSMIGVNAGGVFVSGCVTNALSRDVGVAVYSGNSVGVEGSWTKTSVEYTSGIGDTISGTPPFGVGVWYCPHKDAFPMQDVSRQAEIKKTIARFTRGIIPVLVNTS